MTQKEIILEYCKDWTPSYRCVVTDTPFGWIGSAGQRRCNELVKEGKLERKLIGKYSHYRTVESEKKVDPLPAIKPQQSKLFNMHGTI